jgi:GTP-binding protein HflX
VRRARLAPGQEVLLVDTVGFIQKLPHSLVVAFRATLEEVTEADLLLHVMDASAEDMADRETAVDEVLSEIGADERPRIEVLNKVDGLAPERRRALQDARPEALLVSARTGEGLAGLREALVKRLELVPTSVRLKFGAGEQRAIAGVYTAGRVLAHEVDGDDVHIEAEIPARLVERYRERIV